MGSSELSSIPRKSLTSNQLGMLVGLASFAMLFGTLILGLLLARARVAVWPPVGSEPIRPLWPTLSTALLLLSSISVHTATRAFEQRNIRQFKQQWWMTIILGVAFVATQALSWIQMQKLGLRIETGLFASIFYTLVGVHVLHVLAALAVLLWVPYRVQKFNFDPAKTEAPRLSSWFWHFLDLVWIVLFTFLVVI